MIVRYQDVIKGVREDPRILEDTLRARKEKLKDFYGRFCINLPYALVIYHRPENVVYFNRLMRTNGFKNHLDRELNEVMKRIGIKILQN